MAKHRAPVFRLTSGLRPEFLSQARDAMHAPESIPTGCAGSFVFIPSSWVPRGLAFNPSAWPVGYFDEANRATFTKPY